MKSRGKWMYSATALAGVIAGSLGFRVAAHAQTPDPAPVEKPESASVAPPTATESELVITGRLQFYRPRTQTTATGLDLPIVDTPQALTVLSEDLLAVAGADDMGAAMRLVPGIRATQEAIGPNDSELFARGFILDVRKGYRINGAGIHQFQDLDFVGLERIEALRGPSAIMFGQNSYGGLVNIVTKKPMDQFSGAATLTAGSFDRYRAELDLTGPLSDAVSGRVAASYTNEKSWINFVENETTAIFPSVSVALSDTTDLLVFGIYQETGGVFYDGSGLGRNSAGALVTPDQVIDPSIFVGVPRSGFESHLVYISAAVEHEFSNRWNSTATVSYNKPEGTYPVAYGEGVLSASSPNVAILPYDFKESFEVWDLGVRLNGGWDWLGQEQQVTLAVEHTSFTNEERFELFFSPDPFNILAPRYDQRISGLPAIFGTNVDEDFSETSVAGQLLLKTSDRLSFLLGARYDWIEWEIGNRNLLSAAPRTQTDISVDAFTPRASVLFGLTEDVNAYYSYSRGFIPGRLIDNFGKQADPERGNQHEIGLKADLLDGRVGAGLAVFQIDRQNVSILDPSVPPGQRRLITGREQRHQGIEIDLIGEVAPNLNLVFSYGYLEAEITRNVANPALVGRRPTRTFDHVGSIAAQYQVESGALAGLFFGGGVSYTGELPVNDANVFFFPSYWLANANVGYDITPKVRVLLNATNLFDETYFTTDGGSLVTQNFQGAPRAFRASLRVNF